jgi:phage protein D
MPINVADAKVEFYNPTTGALRYSLTDHLKRIEILEFAKDESDDASIDVAHDFADLANFVIGDEVRVSVQMPSGSMTHIWTGILDNVASNRSGPSYANLPLRAQNYVYWKLAHTYVTDSFTNQKGGAIVRSIVGNFAAGIDTSNVEDTGTTIPSIVFQGESLLSAIRRIATFCNATFKGDKDKKLHFYEKATKSSGQTVDADKVVRGTFHVERSFSDFGNVVTVYGGKRKTQDAVGPTTFSSFATVTGLVRKKARFFFSKAKVARVELWTDPEDADTVTTLAETISADGVLHNASVTKRAQGVSFAQQHILRAGSAIKLKLKKLGAPTGTATIRISTDKDTGGSTATLDVSTLATSYGDISFTLAADFTFLANTTYYLTLSYSGGDGSNNILWAYNTANPYLSGTRWTYTGSWAESTGDDHHFSIAGNKVWAGPINVRIQADNAAGTAPVAEADSNFDLASISVTWDKLSNGDRTSFDLPDHIVPPGNYVWVIVESDANSQRVGQDGSGNILYWTYFDLPVIAQQVDATSISTYGRWELQPVSDGTVQTEEEAEALANRVLAEHKTPLTIGSYEVLDPNVGLGTAPVGQTVSATFTKDGISAGTSLIILEKRHVYDAETGAYTLTHAFSDAQRIMAVEDILRSFQDRIKRLEEKQAATSVLSLITTLGETVRFADTVTAEVNLVEYSDSKVGDTAGHAKVGNTHRVRPS